MDLSILGLLLGTRHLVLVGASDEGLRPARRLLIFVSVVTLALNVADPLVAGEYGKAAFDAVGPVLLIGWAEVGPGFLQAIGTATPPAAAARASELGVSVEQQDVQPEQDVQAEELVDTSAHSEIERTEPNPTELGQRGSRDRPLEVLLEQAQQEDAAHRAAHQKPISADNLRVRLRIGATPARQLVKTVRAEFQATGAPDLGEQKPAREDQNPDATLAA